MAASPGYSTVNGDSSSSSLSHVDLVSGSERGLEEAGGQLLKPDVPHTCSLIQQTLLSACCVLGQTDSLKAEPETGIQRRVVRPRLLVRNPVSRRERSVCPSCCNSKTGWLKNKAFISHGCASWESKIKVPTDSVFFFFCHFFLM